MKKDDFEELDDEIIDDEVIDDEEVVDDEEIAEAQDVVLDEPKEKKASAPKAAPVAKKKAQNSHNAKKGMSKGTKIVIISSSAAVGVIAIALVVLFVILPLFGINVFSKKIKPYFDSTASYGLYFYGDNHTALNDDYSSDTIDMIRAKDGMTKSYFDPSKPTIIWFHGWEPDGSVGDRYLMAGADTRKQYSDYDCQYAQELKAKGYNVATFQFQGVNPGDKNYAAGLGSIYKYAVDSFNDGEYSLSFMFASEVLSIFGEDYAKDITFVGHSCGGFMATATNYMLQYFYQQGFTSNKHLIASRLTLVDPYVNTLGDIMPTGNLMGTKEDISDRDKCTVVLDMVCSLHENSNVAVDVYLGMSGASSKFIVNKNGRFDKVMKHCVVADMTGIKSGLSNPFYSHVVTRDWVWASSLNDKLEDQDGNLAPSLACTNEEILSLVGNLYEQQYDELDLTQDSMLKVSDTSGFDL